MHEGMASRCASAGFKKIARTPPASVSGSSVASRRSTCETGAGFKHHHGMEQAIWVGRSYVVLGAAAVRVSAQT